MAIRITEDTFSFWSKGPAPTETIKAENAARVICDALNADVHLAKMNIRVFTQGSYRARTNVRLDSDVDGCILARDYLFCQYPAGSSQADFGVFDSGYTFYEFKDEVEGALVRRFGTTGATRGNKAFDVLANTYRIDADVVPAFEHRRYTGTFDAYGNPEFLTGVQFFADDGKKVINWPEQTYSNGIAKNDATGRRYKRVIRILKRLRNRMQDESIREAEDIGSFLIECLVWNTPDWALTSFVYTDNIRSVLAHAFNGTIKQESCNDWGEVNELKYLFRPGQPWTRQQAHGFLSAAWDYIGFE